MKVTLFIPACNEIDGVREIMPRIKKEWVDEIIVVDGNSTDGTREYFEERGYRVIRQKSKGICGAYWECFEVSTGDIIVAFSPDNNSLPEGIPLLIAKIKEGYDMVIASRYAYGAKSQDDDVVTAFGNWLFTQLVNMLFRARYTDTLVMMRAFKREIVNTLKLDVRNYPVMEILLAIRCAKKRLKVVDVPLDEPRRIGGIRKTKPLYNGFTILVLIIRELFLWR